jgi:molecular chaperone GrpE
MKRTRANEMAERDEPEGVGAPATPAGAAAAQDASQADGAVAEAPGEATALPLGDLAPEVVAAFEHELAEARRQADRYHDLYLRAEADLDNLRKRGERLREEALARQRRELLMRFLDVADNLERALAYSDAEPEALMAGVESTYRELGRILAREGVAAIDAMDAAFDPALHEAVSVVAVPGIDGERVVAVEQPGYTLDGELLRPARVIVGRPLEP